MAKFNASSLELDPPAYVEPIIEVEPVVEATFQTQEVEQSAKESLDFLAALCMPVVFRYLFPPVFKSIWNWLVSYVHKTRDFPN